MNRNFKIIYPVVLAIAVASGILIGSKINRRITPTNIHSLKLFQSDKLSLLLKYIEADYVDSVDNTVIIEKIIPEILNQLDPHSTYISASDMMAVNEDMRGNFSGIGVQFVMQSDTVMIIDVISGGPSKDVGILAGDRIVEVNGQKIAGLNIKSDSIVSMLRGKEGTIVNVSIHRPGFDNLLEFEIKRGEIPIFSIDVAYMITDKIGLIKVNRFAETTYKEFVNAIQKLNDKGAEKLIVDLRGNSGGSLQGVIKMVDEFLPANQNIVFTKGKARSRYDFNSTDNGLWEKNEIAVLIDEFSASASEIFAGAIQDNDRGIVVGRRSYGKGFVQEQIPFYDGSALRLTVARFYSPSGRCIQKPYSEGNEAYHMDFHNRLIHNELNEIDSIHFTDTIKYFTKGGRPVYAGGGIMPDFFVPVDTSGYNQFYSKIASKNLVYYFAFDYADKNRKLLHETANYKKLTQYLNNIDLFSDFLLYVKEKGIAYSKKELDESEKYLKTQLYAYVSRNIFGDDGFYPVIFEIDLTVKKTVELLNTNWDSKAIAGINKTIQIKPD